MKFNALFLAVLTAATATVTPSVAKPRTIAVPNYLVTGCETVSLYDKWQVIEADERLMQVSMAAMISDLVNGKHMMCVVYSPDNTVKIISEDEDRKLACIAMLSHKPGGQFSTCYWVAKEALLTK